MGLAALIVLGILWAFRNSRPKTMNSRFRRAQVASAAFVALAHGTNDAQKTMGVIALALVTAHPTSKFHVPVWVIAAAATSMAAGTYSGGWRIISTLGRRLTTVTGSVLGAGAVRRFSAVRWGVVKSILVAWLFTFPAAAVVAATMVYVTRLPGGTVIVFVLAIVFSAIMFRARHNADAEPVLVSGAA
jgi:PiT family inorganic phosphate transporter